MLALLPILKAATGGREGGGGEGGGGGGGSTCKVLKPELGVKSSFLDVSNRTDCDWAGVMAGCRRQGYFQL